jgi:hypothetical protein
MPVHELHVWMFRAPSTRVEPLCARSRLVIRLRQLEHADTSRNFQNWLFLK